MVVDLSDRGHRLATNLVKLQVANTIVGQAIAFAQEFVHGRRPVMNCFAADRERIYGIAKGAAKDCHEARYRSHCIHWRAMGLHEQCIRIYRQQCRQGKHVSRRFQYPASGSPPKLQMLKKPAMISYAVFCLKKKKQSTIKTVASSI